MGMMVGKGVDYWQLGNPFQELQHDDMVPLFKDLFKGCPTLMLSFPHVLHRHDLEVEVVGGR